MTTAVLIGAVAALAVVAGVLLLLLARPAEPPPRATEPASETLPDLAEELQRLIARYVERTSETPRALEGPSSVNGMPRSRADDLDELLERTLRTALAIDAADAALAYFIGVGEPIVGTAGLDTAEAERLAGSLPIGGARMRSIDISFEYEEDERAGLGARRLTTGLAVPLERPARGLVAVFSRERSVSFGEDHVEQLEQVARAAGPASAALLLPPQGLRPVAVEAVPVERHTLGGNVVVSARSSG